MCSDKNITLLKKGDNAGRVLSETQDRLPRERGKTAIKRGLSCEGEELTESGTSNTGGLAKRIIALFSEASINSALPAKSVKDQGTQTDQEDSSASVSVSLVSSIKDKSCKDCEYLEAKHRNKNMCSNFSVLSIQISPMTRVDFNMCNYTLNVKKIKITQTLN